MSNTPGSVPPNQPPAPHPPRRRHPMLIKVGAGLGSAVLLGGVVVAIWGNLIITQWVLPRVEAAIDGAIERPIDIGDVEGFSLWSVRLGKTTLPPIAADKSTVTVDAVEISIGLRSLIFHHIIKPNIVLVHPQVSLVQGQDGKWFKLKLPKQPEKDRPVTLEVQSIEVKDAGLTATPFVKDDGAKNKAVVPRKPVQVANADATVEFLGEKGKQVSFDLTADAESGELAVKGKGDLKKRTVKANVRAHDLSATGINIFLPNSLGLSAGTLDSNVTLAAALTEDGKLDESALDAKGTARFHEGEVKASALSQPVTDIHSQLRFKGQQVSLEDTGLKLDDNILTASGAVDLKNGYDITAQIPSFTLDEVQKLAAVNLPVKASGAFLLNAKVIGKFDDPQVQGSLANLQPLQVDKLSLTTVAANFALTLSRFDLSELRLVPTEGGAIVAKGQADLRDLKNPTFQLTGQADLPADAFAQTYGITVPQDVVVGDLTADIQAAGSLKAQTASAQWQLSNSTFPGTGEVRLVDNTVVLDNTRLRVANGTVTAAAIAQLKSGDWRATASTDRVPVEQFTSQAKGLLNADVEASGNLDALNLKAIQAGGTAAIANAQLYLPTTHEPLLDSGDWKSAFQWQGDRIALKSFTAPGIQADGTIGVDFTQQIPIGKLALNVALQSFDLQPLNSLAPSKVKEYGRLSGLTSFNGQLLGTLQNPQIEGNAQLDNLAINQLLFEPLAGPVAFSLADGGRVNLQGRQDRLQLVVSDSLQASIRNRTLPALSFEVQNQAFVAKGYGEDHQLHADIVQLPLGTLGIQPAAKYGFGAIAGSLDASVDADLTDFSNPVAKGSLTVAQPSLEPVKARQLTANFTYANSTATVKQGELLFDDSRYLLAGSATLSPQIQYDGTLTVAEGRVEDLVPIVEQLNLSAFGFGVPTTPTGSAVDLATRPVGLPNATFRKQLQNFVAFLKEHPPEESDPGDLVRPSLDDLAGKFTGVIKVAGKSLAPADLTADFNLQGNSWEWEPRTQPNEFVIRGGIKQQTIALDTVHIDAGETAVDLSGSGNLDRLKGKLTVNNLPVELAELIYPLPATIEGNLDVVTTFGGSLANPAVEGKAKVVDTRINQQPIDTVGANFSYRNAVLNLDSKVAILPTDSPITIKGDVPYALPFMTAQPPTDRLAITAVVPNDSFEIINSLTNNRVRWEAGNGEVDVRVGGTLQQPAVAGKASFREGAISSKYLRDPLTHVNGDIQFNLQQAAIQQLQATMGDGQVAVTGRLPLLPSGQSILAQALSTPQVKQVSQVKQAAQLKQVSQLKQTDQTQQLSQSADGLVIALNRLPVDYSDTLSAVFEGRMFVTGAVLAPTVSGNVEIDDGQVQANKFLRQAGSIALPTTAEVQAIDPYRAEYFGIDPLALRQAERPPGLLDRLVLQNLELKFGDRLAIIGTPFYNISALGSLTVNGPLTALQPDGVIRLKSGWVNLFSTQFRLDPDAPNTATFTPKTGLDPLVDVVMTARVKESNVTPTPTVVGGFLQAETEETGVETIGDIRYIRVQATATGPASELRDNLALTSDPPRDQGELLALVGSSVFSELTGASYTQLAGFLGGGELANFGDRIADAVGLRSFSVFPTTDTASKSSVGIGIGVEASAGLGKNLEVSYLNVINSGNPPQLGLQYRFSEQLQLQGASNLQDTDFKLEYRIKF